MSDLKSLLQDFIPKLNSPKGMEDLTAIYQFKLTDGDDHFYVDFKDGNGSLKYGEAEEPNITLKVSQKNMAALLAGNLNPTMAAMTGKLKIKGDMSLAMKLQNIL